MSFSSSALYLSLIREAMVSVVEPALTSPNERATASVIVKCVDELLRREQEAGRELRSLNATGEEIAEAFEELLGARRGDVGRSHGDAGREVSFDDAAAQFQTLLTRLQSNAQKLTGTQLNTARASSAQSLLRR